MSNPIFYAADMSAAVFTSNVAADASFPLTNLFTNLPSVPWKSSSSAGNQYLKIDLGIAKPCDFISFGALNFANMTQVILYYDLYDDPGFANGVNAASLTGGSNVTKVFTFTKVTKRYWTLMFVNCNGLIPQCGLLLLGAQLAMPYNYNMDAELGNKLFVTTAKEALEGTIRTSRQIAGRKRMEVTFTLIDDATVTAFQTMMDAIQGQFTPFFFKDHLDVVHIVHFEDDYVPATGKRANVNDLIRLKMRHQTTG